MTKSEEARIKALEKRVAELEARPAQVHNHYHYNYPQYVPTYQPQPLWPTWVYSHGTTATAAELTVTN